MTTRTEHSALALGAELALKKGGQGRIILVDGPRDVDGGRLIYKRYRPEWVARVDEAALDALGDLPGRAGADAAWLRERTAWPRTLVTEGGRVVGFLMREIPGDFTFPLLGPSGVTQTTAEYAFLLNDDRYLQSLGLMVSDRDRLRLLADVADSLGRLHRLGAGVGDLSPKNMLFALAGHRTFFLDCDSMRLRGRDVLPQVHTPEWDLPGGEEPATPAADTLKFGLLAIRMFARDQSSRDPSPLGAVRSRLADLARTTQNPDPGRRGTPEDWIGELRAAAEVADPNPPTATIRVPSPPLGGAVGGGPGAGGPGPGGAGGPGFGPGPGPGGAGHPPPGGGRPAPGRNRSGLFAALGVAAVLILGGGAVSVVNGVLHSVSGVSSPPNAQQGSTGGVGDPGGAEGSDPNGGGSLTTSDTNASTDSPSPTDTPTPTPPPPPPATTSVGVVQIAPALVDDPRAVQVATLFDAYYSGVTAKNFDKVFTLYDPSGDIDTNDSQQRDSLEKADATSIDDDATVTAVSPGGPDPVTTADVTFRSRQQPGYGPGNDPGQTCTMWSLTYTLTYSSSGQYLIKSATGTPASC